MRRTSNLEKGQNVEKEWKTFSPHLHPLSLLHNSTENPPAEQTPKHPKEKTLKIDRSSANICRFSGRRTRADEQQPSLTFNYLMTLSIIQSMFTRICYNLLKLFNTFHRSLSQHAIISLPPLPLELGVDEGKRKYSDLVASLPCSLKTMNFHSRENKWETKEERARKKWQSGNGNFSVVPFFPSYRNVMLWLSSCKEKKWTNRIKDSTELNAPAAGIASRERSWHPFHAEWKLKIEWNDA